MFGSKEKSGASDLDQIKSHLEFLGYAAVEPKGPGDILLMEHQMKPNVFLDPVGGGVRIRAVYRLEETASQTLDRLYGALNEVNGKSVASSFSSDGNLLTVSYWLAAYTKTGFGNWLAAFDYDLNLVSRCSLNEFVQ